MKSRRQFLAASAAAGLFPLIRTQASPANPYPYSEFESRIARRDFRDITKDVLPTPCMMVDLEMFEQNIRKMADHSKTVGINVRPHVKVHKSVEVAKRQVALGAIGLTVATVAEAELMSAAGIQGVLWTKQPVSRNNIQRAIALSKRDPSFMFVAGRHTGRGLGRASRQGPQRRNAASPFPSLPACPARESRAENPPWRWHKSCNLHRISLLRANGVFRERRAHQGV